MVRTAVQAAAVGLLLVALFAPWPWQTRGELEDWLHDFVHIPLFAIFTACLWNPRYPWRLAIGLGVVVVLTELLQPLFGREAQTRDVIFGWAGVAWVAARAWGPYRRAARLVVTGLVVVSAGIMLSEQWAARRVFPLLADARSPFAARQWRGEGCRISRAFGTESSTSRMLKITVQEKRPYPGVYLVPAHRDWRGMSELIVRLHWPHNRAGAIWIRVDDRRDTPPYAERVQSVFPVSPGDNILRVSRSDWDSTPSGRSFRWDHVQALWIFFDLARVGDSLEIYEVRLWPDLKLSNSSSRAQTR